jgi:predicted anti-sigma-YlaC factor YlaD
MPSLRALFERLKHRRHVQDSVDCAKVRNVASGYIDHELREIQETKVRNHLELCPPCNAFVASLRKTVLALQGLGRERGPDSLKEQLQRKYNPPGPPQSD